MKTVGPLQDGDCGTDSRKKTVRRILGWRLWDDFRIDTVGQIHIFHPRMRPTVSILGSVHSHILHPMRLWDVSSDGDRGTDCRIDHGSLNRYLKFKCCLISLFSFRSINQYTFSCSIDLGSAILVNHKMADTFMSPGNSSTSRRCPRGLATSSALMVTYQLTASTEWIYDRDCRRCGGRGAVVIAPCLESRRLRVRTPLWPSRFKEKSVSSPFTRKYSILWEASVTER